MEHGGITESVTQLVLQLSVILLAAKIAAEICERYLNQPSVLGELLIGVAIGPYALGAFELPFLGALFPLPHGAEGSPIPVSLPLWSIAQVAAVILLFMAGLETDMKMFLRYSGPATVIAIGGVVFPFLFGAWATVFFLPAVDSWTDPAALFMGAIMVATSVGITARVLSDINRLDTPEGVTILAGAVVDDVLGILILAVVIGVGAGGEVSGAEIAGIAGRAVGVWIAITGAAILLANTISKLLFKFTVTGGTVATGLALCFFAAAMAEKAHLAMIIGAYSLGLGLSASEVAEFLEERLRSVYDVFVPIFFVVMGTIVDLKAVGSLLVFGGVITLLAIVSKVAGCGIPALAVGFNRQGALRVGVGMLPRGEVALIVAGVGIAAGIIGPEIYGVSILMTLITTLMAPVLLVPLFRRGGPGRRSDTAT